MRNLLGAVGTAALVPVGLLVAVAVAAGVGGGGLGGLGQIVGGPTLPGEDPVVIALGSGTTAGGGDSAVPAIPSDRTTRRGRTVAEKRTGTGGSGAGGTRPGGATGGSGGTTTTGTTGTGTGPGAAPTQPSRPATPGAGPTAPPSSGSGSSPAPTPAPQPDPLGDVVRGLGDTVDGIVRPIPVAGPPVADAVGTVIDLVAPPRSAATPAATPAP